MTDLPPIREVWLALGGELPKRGSRVKAFWRSGNGLSVSLNFTKNTWYDFVASEGGGTIKLAAAVLGTDTKGAFRWLKETFNLKSTGYTPAPKPSRDSLLWHRAMAAYLEDLKVQGLHEVEIGKPMIRWMLYSQKVYEHGALRGMDIEKAYRAEKGRRPALVAGLMRRRKREEAQFLSAARAIVWAQLNSKEPPREAGQSLVFMSARPISPEDVRVALVARQVVNHCHFNKPDLKSLRGVK